MIKKALITGISGQDGSYLSEYLISLGYEVHGILRRLSVAENQDSRINNLDVILHYSDISDTGSLFKIINSVKPDEIYNLAAMSHVRISFDKPTYTVMTNGVGVINLLEILNNINKDIKFYQASSSEMFGNSIDDDGYQRLNTPMIPVSPYGCAKVLGYNLVRHFREAYKKFYCNGILFNHESPRRGSNFVTAKVVKTAIEIKKGQKDKLELGNLDSKRDWGHSKDYVRAMHLIMNANQAEDWIVSTGETKSVRDLCEYVFKKLGMNYKDFVIQNQKFMRPEELKYLKGDSSKIRKKLNWKPQYTFENLIDEMINYWLDRI